MQSKTNVHLSPDTEITAKGSNGAHWVSVTGKGTELVLFTEAESDAEWLALVLQVVANPSGKVTDLTASGRTATVVGIPTQEETA